MARAYELRRQLTQRFAPLGSMGVPQSVVGSTPQRGECRVSWETKDAEIEETDERERTSTENVSCLLSGLYVGDS